MEKSAIKNNLEKIVVNVGLGRLSGREGDFENRVLPEIIKELTLITGQRGQVIRSKQAISGFKLRLGQVAGIRATIRGSHAVDFLGRLINIVLPRIKDFRGLSPHSIDRGGVLNIGLKDKSIFPEIIPEESRVSFGLEVSIIPKTRDRAKALSFYKACRLPLKHG